MTEWRVGDLRHQLLPILDDSGGAVGYAAIPDGCAGYRREREQRQMDNARLFAAAQALEDAVNTLLDVMGPEMSEWERAAFDKGVAALKKARGEE